MPEVTIQRASSPASPICKKYQRGPRLLQDLRQAFRETGYLKLPGLLSPDVFRAVSSEVTRLHTVRVRKDFVMPDFDTDRKMSVLGGSDVVRQSEAIARFYACAQLRDWIRAVTGTQIHPVLHDEEFLVINFLDGVRDTHGWHLDDPRYALIVVVESPAAHMGGRIEYVPDWKRLAREHGFDAHRDVERGVAICKQLGRLHTDTLVPGDCYLLDAAEVLHRVSPMAEGGSRKALNMAFDDRRYREYGETARRLYG